MEVANLTLHGEAVDRFAAAFVESKTAEKRRSINRRGVRNIHRYQGEGFTQVAYERAAAHTDAWLLVSLLVERVDEETASVVLMVGGGGEGPFKLEEVSMQRLLGDEESFGSAGRFAGVLREVEEVCDSLDLTVTVAWESGTEESTAETVTRKLFES